MKSKLRIVLGMISVLAAGGAYAYPNGTPHYVTDVGPYCAACHASVQRETMRGMGAGMADGELAVNKHLLPLKERRETYTDMSAADAKKLLEHVQSVDRQTAVTLEASESAVAGQIIDVTAKFKGGAGPVVGLMLLDNNLRWESRSPAADGWLIQGTPKIVGSDGKVQTKFVDHRSKGLKKNLNYVMAEAPGTVTWSLRAPSEPGNYTLAVALLYGTEKSSDVGRGAVLPGVGQLPKGGFEGHSGRILFSEVKRLTVK